MKSACIEDMNRACIDDDDDDDDDDDMTRLCVDMCVHVHVHVCVRTCVYICVRAYRAGVDRLE